MAEQTVAAGEESDVLVGVYEDTLPEPRLTLEVAQGGGTLDASFVRQNNNGDYTLLYHLFNKGTSPIKVIIRGIDVDITQGIPV